MAGRPITTDERRFTSDEALLLGPGPVRSENPILVTRRDSSVASLADQPLEDRIDRDQAVGVLRMAATRRALASRQPKLPLAVKGGGLDESAQRSPRHGYGCGTRVAQRTAEISLASAHRGTFSDGCATIDQLSSD